MVDVVADVDSSGAFAVSHTYVDDGDYTVVVTPTDDFGLDGDAVETPIVVDNVGPTIRNSELVEPDGTELAAWGVLVGDGGTASITETVVVREMPVSGIVVDPGSGGADPAAVAGRPTVVTPRVLDDAGVPYPSDPSDWTINGVTVSFPTASPHTITATHASGASATFVIEVIPDVVDPTPTTTSTTSPTGPSGELPQTGAEVARLLLLALGLVVVGVALLDRRRRRGAA